MSGFNLAIYAIAASLCLLLQLAKAQPQTYRAEGSSRTTPMLDTMRPLYVFTPSISDSRVAEQLSILRKNKKEGDERQLVILLADQSQTLVTVPEGSTARLTRQDSDQAAARRRFKVSPLEFTVILVGKDGGEKLRSHQPIPFARLRDIIDSMPMRRQEMSPKN